MLRKEEQGCKTVEVTKASQTVIQRKIFVYNHLLFGDMFTLQCSERNIWMKKRSTDWWDKIVGRSFFK